MTIATSSSAITYIGNGATTDFSYTFGGVTDETWLHVRLITKATTASVALVLDVDYSVDLGTQEVTYPLVGSPMPATHALLIKRVLPSVQGTSFSAQGSFNPETLENALDYITMLVQQVDELIRSQSVGPTLPGHTVATLPSALSGTPAIIFVNDAAGGGVVCFSDGTNWRRIDTRAIVS